MLHTFSIRKLSVVLLAVTLAGCSTMSELHDKLVDMQLQKKQLANGKTVYVNTNVLPAANWGCAMTDAPQYYNWAEIRMAGQFQFAGPIGLLTQKALDYANQQSLKANYINLGIPTENTVSTGPGRLEAYADLHPNTQAVITYYTCHRINPEHRLGAIQKTDSWVKVGG